MCLNTLYWKDYINLLLISMFIWIPKSKVDPFTLSCIHIIHYFKILYACMPGSSRKHPLDKAESIYGCIPICKIASPYLIFLKYFLKALLLALVQSWIKTLICYSYGCLSICKKLTFNDQIFIYFFNFYWILKNFGIWSVKAKLGMSDHNRTERLNQFFGSKNV